MVKNVHGLDIVKINHVIQQILYINQIMIVINILKDVF